LVGVKTPTDKTVSDYMTRNKGDLLYAAWVHTKRIKTNNEGLLKTGTIT